MLNYLRSDIKYLTELINDLGIVSFANQQFENVTCHVIVCGITFPCYISHGYLPYLFERQLNYQQNDTIFNAVCNVVNKL